MLPVTVIKLLVSRRLSFHCQAEQRPEGVEGVEPSVEPKRELVEVGLQMLSTDAVVRAVEPRLEIREDEVNDRQVVLCHVRISAFSDGKVLIAFLGKGCVTLPSVGDYHVGVS